MTIILNFANCDMVGHTGVYDAAVEAVETVGQLRGPGGPGGPGHGRGCPHHRRPRQCRADAGPGRPAFTAHTTNPVPSALWAPTLRLRDGRLADIAPTMLDLMGLDQPEEMDGKTLILN